MAEDNIIYIGAKPTMNYVLALITQFHNNAKEVTIKAVEAIQATGRGHLFIIHRIIPFKV